MSRHTCHELGICQGIACATCPSAQPWPKPAPGRDTDAENLAQWQNALLAQAQAERADAEERERIAKVLAPLRAVGAPHKPTPWQPTKDAIDSEERESGNAEFLRALLICTACFWAATGLALWLF